jgi:hypothetical protein
MCGRRSAGDRDDCVESLSDLSDYELRRAAKLYITKGVAASSMKERVEVLYDEEPVTLPYMTEMASTRLIVELLPSTAGAAGSGLGATSPAATVDDEAEEGQPPACVLSRLERPEPVHHDSMRTILSNEEADAQARREAAEGVTLAKCLRNMRETHILKGDDAWFCPKCKEHRESTTESSQYRLPDVLTIQLKRFKANSYGTMSKIDTPVSFPLELDMAPFLEEDVLKNRSSELASSSNHHFSTHYRLCGVVYHSGSLSFGHYTAQAFCDGAGEWIYYNDSHAYAAGGPPSPEGAYLLFYQRYPATAAEEGRSMPPAFYGSSDASRHEADNNAVALGSGQATAPPSSHSAATGNEITSGSSSSSLSLPATGGIGRYAAPSVPPVDELD